MFSKTAKGSVYRFPFLLLLVGYCLAITVSVPADYATFPLAYSGVSSGDTIIFDAG